MYPLGALPPPPPGAHLTMTLIIVGNEEAKMSSLLKLKVNLPVSGFAFAALVDNRQPTDGAPFAWAALQAKCQFGPNWQADSSPRCLQFSINDFLIGSPHRQRT